MQIGDTVSVKSDALGMGSALTPAMLVAMRVPNCFTVKAVSHDADGDELLALDCCGVVKDQAGFDVCHAHPAEYFDPCAPEPIFKRDRETIVEVPILGRVLELGHYQMEGDVLQAKIPGLAPIRLTGALAKAASKGLQELGFL